MKTIPTVVFGLSMLCMSNLSAQVSKYPYIMDSTAVAIDASTINMLCGHQWSLVKLEETLRGETRAMRLSGFVHYTRDSSFVESGNIGKFKIEDTFYITHYGLEDRTGSAGKTFIKGPYFIGRINDGELVLVRYSTTSLDWKKEYYFERVGE